MTAAADALMGIFGFNRVEGEQMKTIEETRRELFEADFKVRRKSTFPAIELSRDSNGGYKYNPAHSDWMAWNAALDAVVIELPSIECAGPSYDSYLAMNADDVRDAIKATNLGLKIK